MQIGAHCAALHRLPHALLAHLPAGRGLRASSLRHRRSYFLHPVETVSPLSLPSPLSPLPVDEPFRIADY